MTYNSGQGNNQGPNQGIPPFQFVPSPNSSPSSFSMPQPDLFSGPNSSVPLFGAPVATPPFPDISNGNDASLVAASDDVRLTTQKITYRKILFWLCLTICGILYLSFFWLLSRAIWDEKFFQILLTHQHIGAFVLALLIVPSALLWGLLRVAYMPEHTEKETDTFVKAAQNFHPAGDV